MADEDVIDPANLIDPEKPEMGYKASFVKGLMTENKNWRTKFEAKVTEADGLRRENAKTLKDLESERTARTKDKVDDAVRMAAKEAGIIDVDAIALLDSHFSAVKLEDGKVVGIEDAIKAAKEAKPHFFGTSSSDPDPQKKPPSTGPDLTNVIRPGSTNTPTKLNFATMSDAEFAAADAKLRAGEKL